MPSIGTRSMGAVGIRNCETQTTNGEPLLKTQESVATIEQRLGIESDWVAHLDMRTIDNT